MQASERPIGVLILNHNGRQWLPPLFHSIRRNGCQSVRIYLIDNCSTDGSVESTLRDHPDVTVIRMPMNLGYCMAYNLAMPHAFAHGCEWVIWANNDILLEPGCLMDLAKAVQSDPAIGVAGPAFLCWDSEEPNYYMKGKNPALISAMKARSSRPVDVDWVEGSFLMVSRDTVEKSGPLDPCFFAFWEEAEFCRRVRYSGKRVVLVPGAWVRHYGGGIIFQGIQPETEELASIQELAYLCSNRSEQKFFPQPPGFGASSCSRNEICPDAVSRRRSSRNPRFPGGVDGHAPVAQKMVQWPPADMPRNSG